MLVLAAGRVCQAANEFVIYIANVNFYAKNLHIATHTAAIMVQNTLNILNYLWAV